MARALPAAFAAVLLVACAGTAPPAEDPPPPAPQSPAPQSPPAPPPPAAGTAIDAAWRDRAQMLFARALDENRAIAQLADLIAAAPKRLSGSTGAADAVRFALQRMRDLGLQNVRGEEVTVPQWVRGLETAAVTTPRSLPLRVAALGGSIATPKEGIEAELVMVRSFAELAEHGERAAGRIVFFNRPMPRALSRTFQAYGEAVPQRTNGAVEAAKAGAVAALVRSVTTSIDEFPHTGAMEYQDGVPMVPAAAVATEDAEALAAMLREGPVRVRLALGCETRGDVTSANVVGELVGRELPDEVVVIGGHLDAWDLGQGAHDDGAGCAHVLEAMRLLRACGIAPRRTIRAVLFMNEENGLRGGRAYARAHAAERCVAAIETDNGGASPQGFSTSLRGDDADLLRPLFLPLSEFGAGAFVAGGGGGADVGPLGQQGVPLFGLITDGQRYFDYHHSAQDTLDKVNERELALGAAALAYAASVLADR
jgi:Zn-dependent M28 family amino/carboxypeptidase